MINCCRKGNPFQGPRLGSCLILRNELSEETHILTKQETLLGRDAWASNLKFKMKITSDEGVKKDCC